MNGKILGLVTTLLCGAVVQAVASDGVVPLACWDGDFSQTTQSGVTLGTAGLGQTAGARALTIPDTATTGLLVNLPEDVPAVTLVVKCANVVPPDLGCAAFAVVRASNADNRVGVILNAENTLFGLWGGSPYGTDEYRGILSEQGGQRCFAFRYNPLLENSNPARGVRAYEFVTGAWREVFRAPPLQSSKDGLNLKVVSFGGPTVAAADLPVLAGVRIDAIAVFGQALGESDLEVFRFASDCVDNHAVAETGNWSEQAWEANWANSPRTDISLASQGTETAVVTVDSDLQMGSLTLSGTAGLQLSGNGFDVQIGVLDAREAEGAVRVDLAPGWATVHAGANLALAESGTGVLNVPAGATVSLENGWQGPVSGEGTVVVDADGTCSLLDRDAFTGPIQLAGGTLVMLVGHEGSVTVAAGATLKLLFTDESYLNGYTAENVVLPAGRNILFVLPNGTEVVGEGKSLPRLANVWTASGTGAWNDPTKWSLGRVPEFGENVSFRNDEAVTVTLAAGMVQPGNVSLEGSGDVQFEGVLDLRGQIVIPSGRTLRVVVPEGAGMMAPAGVVGGGTLVKAGEGTLAVQPDNANVAMILGAMSVEGGLLTIAGGRVEGAFALAARARLDATGELVSSNAVSFAAASNATVFASGSARLSVAGSLTVAGDAPLALGCVTECSGTFTVGESGVVLSRDSAFEGPLVGAGRLTVAGGLCRFDGTRAGYSGRVVIESGAVASAPGGSFGSAAIEGDGILRAQGVLPDSTLCAQLQSDAWRGTCWLYAISGSCESFNPAAYGNRQSRVRLTGVTGYLAAAGSCDVPVELMDEGGMSAFTLDNGYSADNKLFTFAKVFGTGTLADVNKATQIVNILDGTEFSGDINVNNSNAGKRIVFGVMSSPPSTSATITVEAGHTNTIGAANTWRAKGGTFVRGVVKAAEGGNVCVHMYPTTVEESGMIEFRRTGGSSAERLVSLARITGTGTIRYAGTTRYLQSSAELRFASTLQIDNALENYLCLTEPGTSSDPALVTIGSLSGSGDFCTAFDGEADSRSLRVVQSHDTVWSGAIDAKTEADVYDRFHTLYVDGADGAASRTLTLAGDNSRCTNALEVCANGSVLLTGTWRGDVTVSGAFGGNGTILDGMLEFRDGAALDLRAGAPSAPVLALSGDTLTVIAGEMPKRATKVVNLTSSAPVTIPNLVLRVGGEVVSGWYLTQRPDGLYLARFGTVLIVR